MYRRSNLVTGISIHGGTRVYCLSLSMWCFSAALRWKPRPFRIAEILRLDWSTNTETCEKKKVADACLTKCVFRCRIFQVRTVYTQSNSFHDFNDMIWTNTPKNVEHCLNLAGGNSNIFYFHPYLGFHDPIWRPIFFKWVGEKPPTRPEESAEMEMEVSFYRRDGFFVVLIYI